MSDFGRELTRRMDEHEPPIGVRRLAKLVFVNPSHISNLRRGLSFPSVKLAKAIDDELGAGGELLSLVRLRPRHLMNTGGVPDDRRPAAGGGTGSESLASALTDLSAGGQQDPVTDLGVLTASADTARAFYQDCRYEQLTGHLSGLLVTLNASCAVLDGTSRDRAHMLSADAHHVAAGLMLKRGHLGLATLAADRSMRAALASGNPVAIAASARIITHALMAGGHLSAAVTTATSHAAQLDRNLSRQTPQSLSVYGALLLRGAVAAAMDDNRGTAIELLVEAEKAAGRLGLDANHCWTAFGPVNALVHRVNIAVTLGDAGAAIDAARSIDLGGIAVTERKATLLVDTARAYLQRGRHEPALLALRSAHQAAPEEVTGRPSVRALVRNLADSAPVTIRRDAAHFAASIGAAA